MDSVTQDAAGGARQIFLAERQRGIGGSDAPVILGVSKWRSPLDLYLEKRGEGTPTIETPAMRWGVALEPVVRQAYCDETGEIVRVPGGMLLHPDYPWMIAHVDGITDSGRVFEAKTARTAEGWGEPGTDEVPDAYLVQVQHYLAVTGLAVADVAVLIGGSDFRRYEVPADLELRATLIEHEEAFWRRVQNADPPPPVTLADMKQTWRTSAARIAQASAEARLNVEALREKKAELAALETAIDHYTAAIMLDMADADTLVFDGAVLATWKTSKAAARFDSATFKAAHPDLYAQFTKTGEPSRRFLLKG